jgi:hypothetical protein
VVSRLWDLRNRYVSHREANLIRLAKLSSLNGLTEEQIDLLVKRARTIADKYGLIYRAVVYSGRVVGWDDYKHLLDLVRLGRQQWYSED